MNYLIIRIYSFECDYPDCPEVDEGGGPYIDDALREIKRDGWTVRDRKHYCPAHSGGAS